MVPLLIPDITLRLSSPAAPSSTLLLPEFVFFLLVFLVVSRGKSDAKLVVVVTFLAWLLLSLLDGRVVVSPLPLSFLLRFCFRVVVEEDGVGVPSRL